MASETCILDPDGDLHLILEKPLQKQNDTECSATEVSENDGSNTYPEPISESETVRFVVSSKHLTLVSPVN